MPAYPLRAAFAGVLLFAIGLAIAGGLLRTNLQDLLHVETDSYRLRVWPKLVG